MTRGQQRCMIYRPPNRRVENACLSCGLSLVACHSWAEHERQRCCEYCDHGTDVHVERVTRTRLDW